MKSQLAEPRGRQLPRVSHYPKPDIPRCYDAALDALAIADVAGRDSMDWQAHVVREGMATDAETDKWLAYEVAVLVARQNGKNGSIEVVELGWLINEPGISVLHTAHEFSTALESMDKLEALILSHPLLEKEIRQIRRGNGREMIQLRNDCKVHPKRKRGEPVPEKDGTEVCRCSTIRFRTRTKSGGRGFSIERLVIDEAMIWSPASQAALMPLLTTAKRPQIWYLGSAADEETHEHCGKWAGLRARAQAGNDRSLLWLEWSAPEPPEDDRERAAWRTDVDNWGQANPSLDYIVTEDYIADEMASFVRDIDKWEIERLSVGRWPADLSTNDLDLAKWPDLVDTEPDYVKPYPQTLAVERNPLTKLWSIAGAQRTRDGGAHVELGWTGSAAATEVVERIVRIVTECNPIAVVIDERSPAAVLKPYLIEAGIEPVMTTTTQLANACQGVVEAIDADQITNSGQQILTDSVGATAKRDLPGGRYAWTPKPGGTIVHFQAVTLAHWALLEFGVMPGMPAPPLAATREGGDDADDREFDALNAAF
jgi:hypothetical protein